MRRPERERATPPGKDRGAHTLRVVDGIVVGVDGDDVFVELGPRMQGVISRRAFQQPPEVGAEHGFTLHGQEEGLWALSLIEEPTLGTWEELEVGSLVQARVVRVKPGGLEVKIGALHAFLPKSQTGLERGEDPAQLVGKVFSCEVTEVDAERQRCSVSRKLVVQRARESDRAREVGALAPGAVVQGRVTRVEDYGVFVRFGRGLEGLIHVSNLAWERVGHPSDVLSKGDAVDAKVLHVKQGGKRIGLGLKQMTESPWIAFAREHEPGMLLEGEVTRHADFGLFVRVARGVEGLAHRSECGLGDGEPLQRVATLGARLSARILSIDAAGERLSLSLLHETGRPIAPDEAQDQRAFEDLTDEPVPNDVLGRLLRETVSDTAPH
jgi:small subunit ribosomal protein S1